MAEIKGFRDLRVYQKSFETSLSIHKNSLLFPKIEQYELASQIRRSSKSVAVNIAEGYGKKSTLAEFKRYLSIALGSCEETRVHLDYCKELEYITNEQHHEYEQAYNEIVSMLVKMIQTWQQFN